MVSLGKIIVRLFMTTINRKTMRLAYTPCIDQFEYLKDLLSLLIAFFKVLLAKIYVKPIKNVAEIFRAKNATMLVLIMPVIKGFNSAAPKYNTPITVVRQSIDPTKTRIKLGNTSDFNAYIAAFSFLLKTYFAVSAA
jgi:hypothetical protein